MSVGSGHVFVVHGDLRSLACDAWLLPSDSTLYVVPSWLDWPSPPSSEPELPSLPSGWGRHGVRTVRWEAWPTSRSTPWLTLVGGGPRNDGAAWFVDGARQFLDAAGQWLAGRPPRHGRARHLVALPLVGTRYGGARLTAGEVVRALLPVMREAAQRFGFDVALVTNEGPAFAAAQAVRLAEGGDAWPELDEELRARAATLAGLAQRGELVLFLGAGVSSGAGLPMWARLITELAVGCGMAPDEVAALGRLGPLDQARIIERRLGGPLELAAAVASLLDGCEVSLSHTMLAALPVREVVTTNYDRLFEFASQAVGLRTAVLPWQSAAECERWLLKMHGCVTRPHDIVLTRQDYLRYAERRAALAGIVQTLLITRHMLFVGFSLEDDNFLRIADAVRKALHGDGAPPCGERERLMGSSLVLRRNALFEELWAGDLDWVGLERAGDQTTAPTARRLEIFLDHMLALTDRHAAHLLDARYEAVLSEAELEVRDALHRLADGLSPQARATLAWQHLRRLLETLGLKGTDRVQKGESQIKQ